MMPSAIDKLRELRALHEDGLLSREEFDSRKNAILDAAYATPADGAPAVSAPPADAAAPQGTEIGLMASQEVGPFERRYRLERLIGHGGMGQVWQATDLATHAELGHSARVALKILPPRLTENGAHARLLIEEAARARQLAHEHIVRVYDWAQDPATASYFIIMECLDGEDLERLMAREGPLPPARALALLAPVADALDYAWARQHLVHRDIKPANVFVTAAGEVKLLDFGIAARVRGEGLDAAAETTSGATSGAASEASPGMSVEAPAGSGTAGYRAPEALQPDAGPPARTLDVHAVAAMLVRMLTGRLPFATGRRMQDRAARPAGLDDGQWAALQAGLSWRPQDRPPSVRALLDGLARRAHDLGLPAGAAPAPGEMAALPSYAPSPAPAAPAGGAHAAIPSAASAAGTAPATPQPAGGRSDEGLGQPSADDVRRARLAEEAAARKKAQLDAATAAARAALDHQRREREKQARAAAEEARRVRKEELARQLRERRELDAEQARREREDALRRQEQAKAAAAHLAEQKRVRAEQAARAQAALAAQLPTPTSPVADTEGVLRDRFLDGEDKGPELVLLPTGRFQMGSPERERETAMRAGSQKAWLAREQPQHWVGIERPVAMGRYPVTVGEWRAFVRATGWRPGGEVDWSAPGFAQSERHPVVGVNWFDALHYLRWLSDMTGKAYRLPSEAEWEYACRAGTKTAFSFGDTISTDQANYDGNFTYNGGARGEYRRGATAVGSFAPNPWGLYDMHGNVWEWVQDVVHDNYDGAPLDGSAWETGGDPVRRILRGGSWLYNPRYLRSALRNGFSAALSNDIVGFRVVRELM